MERWLATVGKIWQKQLSFSQINGRRLEMRSLSLHTSVWNQAPLVSDITKNLQVERHSNGTITLPCPLRDHSLHTFTHPLNGGVSIAFRTLLWMWVCLSVLAFVSVQRRAFDDSFSLNNIKRRCEMISDSACCLSLCSVSRLSQHLITRTLLCCLENVTERRGEERAERKRGRVALWDVETTEQNTSVEMTLWGPAVDFWS